MRRAEPCLVSSENRTVHLSRKKALKAAAAALTTTPSGQRCAAEICRPSRSRLLSASPSSSSEPGSQAAAGCVCEGARGGSSAEGAGQPLEEVLGRRTDSQPASPAAPPAVCPSLPAVASFSLSPDAEKPPRATGVSHTAMEGLGKWPTLQGWRWVEVSSHGDWGAPGRSGELRWVVSLWMGCFLTKLFSLSTCRDKSPPGLSHRSGKKY